MTNPLGNTTSAVVGAAVGIAGADMAAPALERAKQQAWKANAYKVLELGDLAELVAEGAVNYSDAQAEAKLNGYDANHFAAAVEIAKSGPGVTFALDMWRKGLLGDPASAAAISTVKHALRKAKIEVEWDDPITTLHNARLSPQEIALGIVRSVIADPGVLVTELDTSDSNVQRYQPLSIDALTEATAGGFDKERLRGLVGSIGLPMSVVMAASAYYRGILTRGAYNQAVLEGDTRPEWGASILEASRQILSASDYANARLRDWITDDEMVAGAAKHGMTADDVNLLYLIHGRPAAPGQMATAAARGIDGPDGTPMDEPQFLKGIAESDIRPEWGPMLWESRFHYPPLFQLSRLVGDGTITADQAADWARNQSYAPEVVDALRASWSKGAGTASKEATAADLLTLLDGGKATEEETRQGLAALGYPESEVQHKIDLLAARRISSAKGNAITDMHGDYKKGALDAQAVRAGLAGLGFALADAEAIVDAWAQYYTAQAANQT